jgi:hypothetical protein
LRLCAGPYEGKEAEQIACDYLIVRGDVRDKPGWDGSATREEFLAALGAAFEREWTLYPGASTGREDETRQPGQVLEDFLAESRDLPSNAESIEAVNAVVEQLRASFARHHRQ